MSDQRAPMGTVTLALACGDRPEPHTMRTVLDMVMFDRELGKQHLHPARPTVWVVGAAFVTNARNRLVQRFLAQPVGSQAEWLLFLDDDQLYPETLLEILMASADPVKRRIVAMPVWRFISKDDGPVRVTHNVFDINEQGQIIEWPGDLPKNALVQAAAVGTGCMLIHRTVLEEIGRLATTNGVPEGWGWFCQDPFRPEGEDIWFCRAAASCQIPVWVNTTMTLQHAKTVMLQGPAPEGVYSIGGEMFAEVVPPPDERVAVIVPVLNRPQNAAKFMASLRATTGMATAYAVCSDDVDAAAWKKFGATVVRTDRITFPQKVNDCYAQTTEPWVFLVGDDVRFHPGWLDQVEHTAHKTGAKVVGTNDLGNPRVTSGVHATHMLIARDYIDTVGASWDGPGIVCHEGYRHNYVDDEIVTAAKQRGAWAPSLASVVEHLHPAWGKAEVDETYRKGQFRYEKDRGEFEARFRASLSVVAA